MISFYRFCKSSVTLGLNLILGMRTSDRGDLIKQNENSAIQEHVTEASLASFAGALRESRGEPRCLFSFRAPEQINTARRQDVDRLTAHRAVDGLRLKKKHIILSVSAPLRNFTDGHPGSTFGR